MKTVECFSCDLTECAVCKYWLDGGYAWGWLCNTSIKRTNEAWNFYHPNDLMPQKGFVVHHDNENTLDDSKENLQKLTKSKHTRLHMIGNQNGKGNKGKKHTEEHKERNRQAKLGNQNTLGYKHTEESIEKNRIASIGNQNALGCKRSEEFKENQRKRMKGNQNAKGKRSDETKEKMRRGKKKYWEEIHFKKVIK